MAGAKILKIVDGIVGPCAVRALSRLGVTAPCKDRVIRRILVIRPGGMGDAILLIPMLAVLGSNYPSAAIDVLAERRNSAIFALSRDVRRIFHYASPFDLARVIQGHYDVVIDSEQWHRLSAVVARLTGARITVGFASNERSRLFTHPIPYSLEEHERDSFLRLLAPLGCVLSHDAEPPYLTVPSEIYDSVRPRLASLRTRPIIALFAGGSIPDKRWAVRNFHGLASRLTERGLAVVVVGGAGDTISGKEIVKGLEHAIDLTGTISLIQTAAVLAASILLVSNDSGILHLGAGVGARTVSLFGPGNTSKWAPRGPGHVALSKKLSCRPCSAFGYTPKCRNNNRCMDSITVDEVFETVMNATER